MKELSVQFISKVTDLTVTITDRLHLLYIAYKIFDILLNKRLIENIENKLKIIKWGSAKTDLL